MYGWKWRVLSREIRAEAAAEGLPCHACGGPIDYEAHYNDARAPVVDHLRSLSYGGPVLVPREELGIAHRGCNSAKYVRRTQEA